ncbi:alkylation response protein AidB-like acyl-CoA dehydrogenase [Elusimicrobium simillimum]
MVAAFGLGAGEEAVETAVQYAQQRVQAGSPLVDKQGYMLKFITPHYIRFEAVRSYIDWVAKQLDVNNHGLATEGAIAKYYATEEGNNAAEHAIQALGGFGYTKEFSVEKIKRDVKITCIYEGTSEVMEMTIYRGRWQEHLKSRGQYYINMAAEMDAAHAKNPNVGADSVALGLKALARILEECRLQKLTRHQFVTFKLGELISNAEVAYIFAKDCAEGKITEGSRFDLATLQTMSRVLAREMAFDVASKGLKYVLGAGNANAAQMSQDVNLIAIEDKMRGIIEDSDTVSLKLKELFKK